MQDPKILLRIDDLRNRAATRAEISVGRVLAEYGKLAFLDIRKAFNETGDLKPISEMDDATAAAVSGLEFEEVFEMQGSGADRERVHVGRIHKLKLTDKRGALDSIAKHLGMFAKSADGDDLNQVTVKRLIGVAEADI